MTIMKAMKEKGVDKNRSDSLFFWTLASCCLIGLPLLDVSCRRKIPGLTYYDFSLNRFGKFLAFAILALGLDLIWGYTGNLSFLGHGVFFGFGAYCIGMHLMLSIGSESVYGSALPDFMVWNQVKELPFFWKPFSVFRSRCSGPFSCRQPLRFCSDFWHSVVDPRRLLRDYHAGACPVGLARLQSKRNKSRRHEWVDRF